MNVLYIMTAVLQALLGMGFYTLMLIGDNGTVTLAILGTTCMGMAVYTHHTTRS